jgi:sensor histidine kinase YesM
MALLLLASLAVMLHYSRRAVKEEALEKASQTLESTMLRIDNILLSVEQTSGNIFFSLYSHLHQPDMIYTYSRKLVESNPYVTGCAIAFEPNYYPGHELFMAYYHHTTLPNQTDTIVQSETFGNKPYTEQVWYTKPMETGKSGWLNPLTGLEGGLDPIITFCMPIYSSQGKPVGVIGVDVSLSLLSHIVLEAKPSANSYGTLLADDGSFIVHPDSNKLYHQAVFTQDAVNSSIREAAQAMLSGETGYRPFTMKGKNYYVFYEPFKRFAVPGRSMEQLSWSLGIVYPENDIFGDYNSLLYYVLAIAVVGLLLLFLLCRTFIHRRLKPLLMLTASAQRIADGHYDEIIPDSHQKDEIGRLQDIFQQMRQSLATHIGELEQLTATMKEDGEDLRLAYDEAQKADRMKTAFLHNMTNQMISPADAIDKAVNRLVHSVMPEKSLSPTAPSKDDDTKDIRQLTDEIEHNGEAIAELLKNLINMSAHA